MKLLLLMAAVLASSSARPEIYKENEDFQYSRSSSDEGSKSGYYGAQRGNMGGNYEKAHNMDGLAQHQMSGLVRQVDGELGEGSNTRAGDVFAAANSRGTYGSGKYDVGNLQGRNFGEGVHVDSSQSHAALSSHNSGYSGLSSSHGAGYSSSSNHLQNSGYSGYHGSNSYGDRLQSSNLQSLENTHTSGAYGASEQSGYHSGHYTQSAYQGHGSYGSSNANQHSSSAHPQNRLIWTVPVKIVGRPGSRVAVPVGVQNYDATHSATSIDHNAITSDAEILNNQDYQVELKPSTSARHYESAYNYRKQWERHDANPEAVVLSIPTENPFPKNSELHEDASSLHSHNHYQMSNSHSSDVQSAHRKSESSQSRQHSGYNSQYSGSNLANSNAYTQGTHTGYGDSANSVGDVNSRPKNYQSAYSYHKSWERHGDPYEIQPVGDGQESQRLTAATTNQGHGHYYDSQHHQSHQSHSSHNGLEIDCDENGHVRVARAVGQQSQTSWQDFENEGQQTQDLRQGFGRSQSSNENFGQENQDWGQTSQQHNQELGQQLQTGTHQTFDEAQDFGQETQNLGQQSQNGWGQGFDRLEDLGQQSQKLGQQSQNGWGQGYDRLEDLGQQSQKLGQQTQNNWGQGFDEQEDLGQQTQNLGQQTQNNWGQGFDKLEDLGQGSHSDLSHQSHQWNDLENLGQQSQISDHYKQPADVNRHLDPPTNNLLIQDTSPVIRAWIPEVNQNNFVSQQKSQSNIPASSSTVNMPAIDIYISVNPNLSKYTKYNDQHFVTSTINKDLTVEEYLNHQNEVIWDDDKVITQNKYKTPVKSGPVKFLNEPSKILSKHYPSIYRGYNNLSHSKHLNGHKLHRAKAEQHKPNKYTTKQARKSYYDWIRKDYQTNTLQGRQNIRENPNHVAWDKSNQLQQDSGINNLEHSLLDKSSWYDQRYGKYKSQYNKYPNSFNLKPQDVRFADIEKDGVSPIYTLKVHKTPKDNLEIDKNPLHMLNFKFTTSSDEQKQLLSAQSHTINKTYNKYPYSPNLKPLDVRFTNIEKGGVLPIYRLQVHKTEDNPEIDKNTLRRLSFNLTTFSDEQKQLLPAKNHAINKTQELSDQPEVYPDLKLKRRRKLKKKKGSLEKVVVDQKNLDDLVEQRDDLSQEIWEQYLVHIGKERNNGQSHVNFFSSKEQSEEVPSMWDHETAGTAKSLQWNNDVGNHLNISIQKLKSHNKAVEDYIYANTGSVISKDNNAENSRIRKKNSRIKKPGNTNDIELAYIKELVGTTTPSPQSDDKISRENEPSPLWSAMESYYTLAKDIFVSWFNK